MSKKNDQTTVKNHYQSKVVLLALSTALLGGGVGGGVVYAVNQNQQTATTAADTTTTSTAATTNLSTTTAASGTASAAYKKVANAVVSVIATQTSTDSDQYAGYGYGGYGQGQSQSTTSESEGSGVIFKKSGDKAYIVTNNHVVDGANKLQVLLNDGTKVTATLVGTSASKDIAVLAIDSSKVTTTASFANSSTISAGESVLAIGSPLGSEYANTVTEGIVSATSRTVTIAEDDDSQSTTTMKAIQTDAAINSGNSGGPLINLNGQIIGITSMKLSGETSSGTTVDGMGFTIPSNVVVATINSIMNSGSQAS